MGQVASSQIRRDPTGKFVWPDGTEVDPNHQSEQDAQQHLAPGGATVNGTVSSAAQNQSAGVQGGYVGSVPAYTVPLSGNPALGGYLNQVGGALNDLSGRTPIQMQTTTADPTQQAQFRNQQLALGQQLMDQANGKGPSVAGSQLQQSTEQNLQAALAQAASSRGGNLGAMQYQLGANRAQIQQQAGMGLAQARIQEQMAARAQLGQVLNEGRGADINLATFNAGQLNQGASNNAQLAVQQQQNVDQLRQFYISQGYGAQAAEIAAQRGMAMFNAGALNTASGVGQGVAVQNNAQMMQLLGAGVGAVGTVAGGAVGGPAGAAAGGSLGSFVANGAQGPMNIQLPK